MLGPSQKLLHQKLSKISSTLQWYAMIRFQELLLLSPTCFSSPCVREPSSPLCHPLAALRSYHIWSVGLYKTDDMQVIIYKIYLYIYNYIYIESRCYKMFYAFFPLTPAQVRSTFDGKGRAGPSCLPRFHPKTRGPSRYLIQKIHFQKLHEIDSASMKSSTPRARNIWTYL